MPGPARAGALIYAKNLEKLSDFYRVILGMKLLHPGPSHRVLESPDMQLILQELPPEIGAAVTVSRPPVLRQEQAIKLFFAVDDLEATGRLLEELGGGLFGPVYPGPGFVARNAFDPEGNIFHLRAFSG